MLKQGLPGGPVVKNSPCNAGDWGLIPGQGTKIPHPVGQLSLSATLESPRATTRGSTHNKRSRVMQLRPDEAPQKMLGQVSPDNWSLISLNTALTDSKKSLWRNSPDS